jgi:SAM-dependent methyltransferase
MRVKLSDTRLASLLFVSICVLAFEIEVMRAFAVTSWSNFGSMVISIALLGFGLAGTLLTFKGKSMRRNPDGWLSGSAFALGPSMATAHCVAQLIPFNPVLIASDPTQLWRIGAFYIAYSLPFFVGGVYIGAVFASLSSRMHRLYFWNMVGSGLGGLVILGLMFIFPPSQLIYALVGIAVLPALLASIHWSAVDGRFTLRATEVALSLSLAVLSFFLLAGFGRLSVSDFKGISYAKNYPDSVEVYSSFSPRGEIKVYSSSYFHFAPGLSDNAGFTLTQMPRNAFLGMYTDGEGPVGVMRELGPSEESYMDYIPMSAPYRLVSNPKVLLLRLGGGTGIHTALHNGAKEVRVVESNPDLIRMLRDVPYFRQYTGDILHDPRVKIENNEVRAFAGSTGERFDIVEIGLIDSIGLSQAGGYSVEENYTYTVEAIREYLACLAPKGILSITVWDRLNPPRNVPKLLSTIVEALQRTGVPNAGQRIFAFNLLLSTSTVLVKNGDFTPGEITKLRAYCGRMSFEVDYYPGIQDRPKSFDEILTGYEGIYSSSGEKSPSVDLLPSDLYHFSLKWLLGGRAEELYARYIFDIRPATDEKPYYSGYIKPAMLPILITRIGDISEEWGYILLLATFLQSLAFGFLIILLPLTLRWRELFKGKRGTFGVILYFSCLGLGYMMAEIYLIQRFVFFLADPVYTNAIVLSVLLISSGFGSLISEKLGRSRQFAVRLSALGIAVLACLAFFCLPQLLTRFLGSPLVVKALIAAACITPLGLCLGIPFPSGLSALAAARRNILPWAWGVNGALSVTGSVLTRIISTSAGFSVVLAVMAGLYLLAGLVFQANMRSTRPGKVAAGAMKAFPVRD